VARVRKRSQMARAKAKATANAKAKVKGPAASPGNKINSINNFPKSKELSVVAGAKRRKVKGASTFCLGP